VKQRNPPSRPRPKAGTSRQKLDCLDVLTGDEAVAVLRELLSLHPDLLPEGRRAANALLAMVSFTDIAKSAFDALALDLEDWDAGPARAGGYVEPSEAAWKAIERAVTPYFHDLERRVKLRHENEATEICKGIVLGLYRAEQHGFELREYAEDCPSELAAHAVDLWQRRTTYRMAERVGSLSLYRLHSRDCPHHAKGRRWTRCQSITPNAGCWL
jgi:hypothetical protein